MKYHCKKNFKHYRRVLRRKYSHWELSFFFPFVKTEPTLTHLTEKGTEKATKLMKRCFTSHVREMKIKRTLRYHMEPIKKAKICNIDKCR